MEKILTSFNDGVEKTFQQLKPLQCCVES